MPQVVFIDSEGRQRVVEAREGESLMRVALRHDVAGMTADCGGACSCATCHVYIADEWWQRIGPPAAMELDMLDFVADERLPTSRLACQVHVEGGFDGLRVRTPKIQIATP
jgi:2Fe-2S ferredoxin